MSELNSNIDSASVFMRDMTIQLNKTLETVQDTANKKNDSIMLNKVVEIFNE